MKSQVNSQELEEILQNLLNGGLPMDEKRGYPELTLEEAKVKLLQLGLSCLPKKKRVKRGDKIYPCHAEANATIDTMEQKIRRAFS